MRNILLLGLCIALFACKESKPLVQEPAKPKFIDLTSIEGDGEKVMPKYMESITEAELKEMLYVYAGDEMEGRETGEPGQKKAVAYLKDFYVQKGMNLNLKIDTVNRCSKTSRFHFNFYGCFLINGNFNAR